MARPFVLALSLAVLASPALVAAQPAKQVVTTVDGQLEVRVEDHRDGRSITRHFVKTPQGRYELRFDKRPTDLPNGTKVRVHGRPSQQQVLALDGAQVEAVTAPVPYTLGEQKVAVLLVNFQDNQAQPISQSTAYSRVFDSTSKFFQENSFDQTWLSGEVFGYYTIALSGSVCDPDALAAQANAAAAAAGVDLSGFKRKVYMFPHVPACQWTGMGHLGGTTTSAWANGNFELILLGHEMGHNFGLHHAHAKNCDVAPLGNTCTNLMYGDASDIMGNVKPGHYSAFQKERLGWLDDGVSPPIHNAASSGRYAIEPYSSQSVGPKAIRVPRGVDANGVPTFFYVEYRQPIGADAALTLGNLTKGVMIRTATANNAESSYQLDMTPGTSTNTNLELSDGALAVGATFADATSGVSITLVSADPNGALVDVTVGTAQTPPPPPTGGTLTETLGLDKSTYLRGETVYMSALVKQDGVALRNATVTFTVTLPNASKTTITATTGTDGYARATYRTAKGKGAAGGYGVRADATNDGVSATASATFSVK